MNENIFDVLIYLFENYLEDDLNLDTDSETVRQELTDLGYEEDEIIDAFDWLESLTEKSLIEPQVSTTFRIFSEQEKLTLDLECHDLLLFLQYTGILSATTREIVIDKAMSIKNIPLGLDELRWIVLMVLLSETDDVAFARMEDIIYDLSPTLLH
ncbi:MAG: DUF494 domain-containing protein [Methylococcales bacterium]|nr:DUF494 domain-containing protein [Methylococcales bacterium]